MVNNCAHTSKLLCIPTHLSRVTEQVLENHIYDDRDITHKQACNQMKRGIFQMLLYDYGRHQYKFNVSSYRQDFNGKIKAYALCQYNESVQHFEEKKGALKELTLGRCHWPHKIHSKFIFAHTAKLQYYTLRFLWMYQLEVFHRGHCHTSIEV